MNGFYIINHVIKEEKTREVIVKQNVAQMDRAAIGEHFEAYL